MTQETSWRAKPRVNVGMLGPAGEGETTLTAAIRKVQAKSNLAEAVSYDDTAKGGASSFEYQR